MSDVLTEICNRKRGHIAERKAAQPMEEVMRAANTAEPTRGFADRLTAVTRAGGTGLIAEIKKASPSKGLIREDFDPESLACAYQNAGATCLSVLTDTPYFQGEDNHLVTARAATGLPALRKDFILDPYQVYEARMLGADCILLIMAALDNEQAAELAGLAADLGMDSLVEVHDAEELERAAELNSRLIGINNRNLKTLNVDLATTEALAAKAPKDRILVAESGIGDHADVERMARAGADCILVGESLMRQSDVGAAVRRLLGKPCAADAAE